MINMIIEEEREELLCDSERLKTCNKKQQWTKEDMETANIGLDTLLIMFLDENEERELNMGNKKSLSGTSLAGMSTTRNRVENDYYATPYESTEALLDNIVFTGNFLEPCVGGGHIADIIKKRYPKSMIDVMDISHRGYLNTIVDDFLTHDFNGKKYDNIITNPPYSLAQEFLETSMSILNKNGKVAMFLKIQFLEGNKRKSMFNTYPPRYVYVFSKRQNPWRNGSAVDEKGKPWSSTMCFAWFIWEEGFKGEPIIRWL